jgi:hypothetical protein
VVFWRDFDVVFGAILEIASLLCVALVGGGMTTIEV